MMIKSIFKLLIFIFIFIVQISFLSSSTFLRENLSIILISFIYFLQVFDIKHGLILGIILGLLLDIFSAYPFGVILISLTLTLVLATVLLINVFTNRSLLSFLLLMMICTLVFYFLTWVLARTFSLFSEFTPTLNFLEMLKHLIGQIIVNTGFGLGVYLAMHFFLNSIRKRFLTSKIDIT